MKMKRFLVLGSIALVADLACNQEIADDIPCKEDTSCPTHFFCNSVGRCASEEASGPPAVEVVGVAANKDDPPKTSVSVQRGKLGQFVYITIRNVGRSEAAYPKVTLTGPECLDVDGTLGANLIGILQTGDTSTQSVLIDPSKDCPSPSQVDVTITVGGTSVSPTRTSEGHFEVVLP